MTEFEYVRAESLEQLSERLLADPEGTRILAGGTDLLVFMLDRKIRPRVLVDPKPIAGLDGISANGVVRIGALTRMRDIERHPAIRRSYSGLARGAFEVGSVQIRQRATIAGNLGTASPAADTPPALLAHGAAVETAGPGGGRTIPLDQFYTGPGHNVLLPGEVIVAVLLPAPAARSGSAYFKLATRKAMDIAFVGVASYLALDDSGLVTDAGVGLGAVAPTPLTVPGITALLRGHRLTDDLLEAAAEAAMKASSPISDRRCSADYRRAMVGTLTKRTLRQAAAQAEGRA